MYDMNDAGPQMTPTSDLIPDGTFAKLRMGIRPGGAHGATAMDAGLLKASRSSDAREYSRRRPERLVVMGLDEWGALRQQRGWGRPTHLRSSRRRRPRLRETPKRFA